jgi:hypothetical protein
VPLVYNVPPVIAPNVAMIEVLLYNELYPKAAFYNPAVFLYNVACPIPVFSVPVVLLYNA